MSSRWKKSQRAKDWIDKKNKIEKRNIMPPIKYGVIVWLVAIILFFYGLYNFVNYYRSLAR